MFIHGLWLLPSSWDRWAALFDEAGYAPVSPGWPDDPDTVDEANANPEVFEREQHNAGVTEFAEIAGRGHALVIDSGWREVAQTALDFIRRFTQEEASPPQSGLSCGAVTPADPSPGRKGRR